MEVGDDDSSVSSNPSINSDFSIVSSNDMSVDNTAADATFPLTANRESRFNRMIDRFITTINNTQWNHDGNNEGSWQQYLYANIDGIDEFIANSDNNGLNWALPLLVPYRNYLMRLMIEYVDDEHLPNLIAPTARDIWRSSAPVQPHGGSLFRHLLADEIHRRFK
jgi:hypothetical protein